MLYLYIFFGIWSFTELANAKPKNGTKALKLTTHFLSPRGTTRLYDPNYGFEPYWPGGDWVLMKNPPTRPRPTWPTSPGETPTTSTTTPVPPTICGGEDCPHAYRSIKEVCVRYSRDNGWAMNDYVTHPTYCHYLKHADPGCIPRKYYGTVFVHIGKCQYNYGVDGMNIPGWYRWYYTYYTANNHLADVSPRWWWHMKKFSIQSEWTKYYPGTPYNVTLFRAKKVF